MLIICFSDDKGSPYYNRMLTFNNFYSSSKLIILNPKDNFLFNLNKIINSKERYILISMPPFKFWLVMLLIMMGKKLILDFRDGWSIAQDRGYGNESNRQQFKAKVTRKIERFIIRKSYVSITCTYGLQKYLELVSGIKIRLIPNGVSQEDFIYAKELTAKKEEKENKSKIVFSCAGKFSEYGVEKVKIILQIILSRYGKNIRINLIGSARSSNQWIATYLNEISDGLAELDIQPKIGRRELYKVLASSDFGISIVRDPSYELGTKVYDYIALGIPVVNYFDTPNNFTNYLDPYLDKPFKLDSKKPEIVREFLIEKEGKLNIEI